MKKNFVKLFVAFYVLQKVILFEIKHGDGNNMEVEIEENNISVTCTLTEEKQKFLELETEEYFNFSKQLEITSCADYKCVFDPAIQSTSLNSTTVKATIKYTELLKASCLIRFTCYFNERYFRLDDLSLIVANASKPMLVQDFDCTFFNFQEVVCSWTGPQNCIYTSYNLTYTPRNSYGKNPYESTSRNPWLYDRFCNESTGNLIENFDYETGLRKYVCIWKLDYPDKVNKFDNAAYYDFRLQISNKFGYLNQDVTFAQYEHVISDAPTVDIFDTTPDTLHLLLGRDPREGKTPCTKYSGFEYLISYKSQYENTWKSENISACVRQGIFFFKPDLKIKNLKYGNDNYTLKVVSVNTNYKGHGDGKSKVTLITAKTKPNIPNSPPETVIGSFEIFDEQAIRIYWKNIRKAEENGDKFHYEIEIDKENINVKTTKNFETFYDLKDRNYTFKIWSVNEVGRSTNYSLLFVPALKYRTEYVQGVTQIFDNTNSQYLLMWDSSLFHKHISNYTIFWCEVSDELLINPICEGNLQWKILPSTVSSLTQSVAYGQNDLFAISANIELTSSGMFWTPSKCKLTKNAVKYNMEIHVEEKNATSITIAWNPNCGGLSYVVGYCPIETEENKICSEPEIKSNISHKTQKYIIKKLAPDRLYLITLTTTSSLFAETLVSKIRTAPAENKLALIMSLTVIGIFVIVGVFILTKRIRTDLRANEIEPVLPFGLTSIVNSLILENASDTCKIVNLEKQSNDDVMVDTNNYNLITENTCQYISIHNMQKIHQNNDNKSSSTKFLPNKPQYVPIPCSPSTSNDNGGHILQKSIIETKQRSEIRNTKRAKNTRNVKYLNSTNNSVYKKTEYIQLKDISNKRVDKRVTFKKYPPYASSKKGTLSGYFTYDNIPKENAIRNNHCLKVKKDPVILNKVNEKTNNRVMSDNIALKNILKATHVNIDNTGETYDTRNYNNLKDEEKSKSDNELTISLNKNKKSNYEAFALKFLPTKKQYNVILNDNNSEHKLQKSKILASKNQSNTIENNQLLNTKNKPKYNKIEYIQLKDINNKILHESNKTSLAKYSQCGLSSKGIKENSRCYVSLENIFYEDRSILDKKNNNSLVNLSGYVTYSDILQEPTKAQKDKAACVNKKTEKATNNIKSVYYKALENNLLKLNNVGETGKSTLDVNNFNNVKVNFRCRKLRDKQKRQKLGFKTKKDKKKGEFANTRLQSKNGSQKTNNDNKKKNIGGKHSKIKDHNKTDYIRINISKNDTDEEKKLKENICKDSCFLDTRANNHNVKVNLSGYVLCDDLSKEHLTKKSHDEAPVVVVCNTSQSKVSSGSVTVNNIPKQQTTSGNIIEKKLSDKVTLNVRKNISSYVENSTTVSLYNKGHISSGYISYDKMLKENTKNFTKKN